MPVNWEDRENLRAESSLLVWYPHVKDLIPSPKTVILPLTKDQVKHLFESTYEDDPKPIKKDLEKAIIEKAREIGYPLFLRSDQSSCKHEWSETCYVKKEADLLQHVRNLIVFHREADMFGGISLAALVFRKFLKLNSGFKAFKGMPVSKERRYFVRDGQVCCRHSYWPIDAILFYGRKPPDDWKQLLAAMNRESADEIEQLTAYALTFSAQNPGFWSVDFAQDEGGKWWLIDAARGEVSWHAKGCPNDPDPEPEKEPQELKPEAWFKKKEEPG